MKVQTLVVCELTVAGEFFAAHTFCPDFTSLEQFSGEAFASEILFYKDTFKVADGGGMCTLYIIVT